LEVGSVSVQTIAVVRNIEILAKDIYKVDFESAYVAQNAKCGQFVNVKCGDGLTPILRRPISICDVDQEKNMVTIVFAIQSTGTKILSNLKVDESLDIIAPLGKGFSLDHPNTNQSDQNILVVGGGIGTFPLYYLLKESKAKFKSAFLGFRNKDLVVLEKEFSDVADEVKIFTDDGSYGTKGLVLDGLTEYIKKNQINSVYACGPTPMLKGAVELTRTTGTPCQVSMEQRMGCGIGACLVCACKVKSQKEGQAFQYKRVCKDGPVFWGDEMIFE
jgi:dihydroorotate dehydrogenase electron transfer subunit